MPVAVIGDTVHDDDRVRDDDERVGELLGRPPAARFEVVVRRPDGDPVVIRNAPFLDDGTPMPTRYWLVGRAEVEAVSRLESAGGVGEAERAVDRAALVDAHDRYAAERDAEVPATATVRPSGGVGGTRRGVKCLHAHYAWHLAGGDDPVGRWVAERLTATLVLEIGSQLAVRHEPQRSVLATTMSDLLGELGGHDPPSPQALANAIGAVTDDLDNLVRTDPTIVDRRILELTGDEAWHLGVVERGHRPADADQLTISRDDVEDLFRTVATERRAERLHNPALEAPRVDTVVATCCAVLAAMRRLQFETVTIRPPDVPDAPDAADVTAQH